MKVVILEPPVRGGLIGLNRCHRKQRRPSDLKTWIPTVLGLNFMKLFSDLKNFHCGALGVVSKSVSLSWNGARNSQNLVQNSLHFKAGFGNHTLLKLPSRCQKWFLRKNLHRYSESKIFSTLFFRSKKYFLKNEKYFFWNQKIPLRILIFHQ